VTAQTFEKFEIPTAAPCLALPNVFGEYEEVIYISQESKYILKQFVERCAPSF
jgi:hypothetical protein